MPDNHQQLPFGEEPEKPAETAADQQVTGVRQPRPEQTGRAVPEAEHLVSGSGAVDPPDIGSLSASPLPGTRPTAVHRYRNFFVGTYGLRAGWRLLMFAGFTVLFSIVLSTIFNFVTGRANIPEYAELVITRLPLLLAVLGATALMARIERRPASDFGLQPANASSLFGSGAMWGFALLTAMLLAIDFGGDLFIHGTLLTPAQVLGYGLVYIAGFLLVGLLEETLFRGYALYTLREGIGFWPAAFVLALLFAFAHRGNPGETLFGLFAVFLFGLVLAFSVQRTGSLWWAIGFHFMWDYSESFIYGAADSGGTLPGHMLNSRFRGPEWITGGSVGPEGSFFIVLVLAALALIIARLYPKGSVRTERVARLD